MPITALNVEPWFARLRVVLVRVRNPLNMGAAARAMSNFGFGTLRMVEPFEPSFEEARSSAVGAADVLTRAEIFSSVPEAVADCSLVVGTTAVGARELLHPLHLLEQGAAMMRAELASAPVALLFGSEKTGLSNEELSHCHLLMRIPTRDEHISMNLGQAVAVCLYELARNSAEARPVREKPRAPAAALESLTQVLMESMRVSGYVTKLGIYATEDKVRRLVRRMEMTETDAEAWLGMMRKVLWKAKHTGGE